MMARFDWEMTPLAGLAVLHRKPIGDARGYLERMFCADDLEAVGVDWLPVQINRTFTSNPGTVRGLHFQNSPHAEDKLVSCIRGRVFDVAVDLRQGSPTFLEWYGAELSAENNRALLIPKGFAHGLQTLSSDCEMLYFHSVRYQPDAEAGLNPMDNSLSVEWPLAVSEMSDRDKGLPDISADFGGIKL